MRDELRFEIFRSTMSSWQTLFEEAASFATSIGRERVLNISHSSEHSEGVVTVWYWEAGTGSNTLGLKEVD